MADENEVVDTKVRWPAWRYGPDGQSEIFQTEDDVPAGWKDHPSKVGKKDGKKAADDKGGDTDIDKKVDAMDDAAVVARLKELKVEFSESWPASKLRAALKKAEAA